MDTYLYNCQYCGKEYKPNRRNKQRFCSNSCRVGSFNQKRKMGLSEPQIESPIKKEPTKIERMSFAGIGNAAVGTVAGTVAVNLITNLLTNEENKPVTKKDLREIMGQNKRFHPVRNVPVQNGVSAFYDMETQSIFYQKIKNR